MTKEWRISIIYSYVIGKCGTNINKHMKHKQIKFVSCF